MKSAVTVILLLFVAASIVYLVIGEPQGPPGPADQSQVISAPADAVTDTTASERVAKKDAQGGLEGESSMVKPAGEVVAESADSAAKKRSVIAYYFHRTQRCDTCLRMQAFAEDAIKKGLSEAVQSGRLEWRAVNVEEPAHEHFVNEYELYASALVMVDLEGDKVKRSKKLGQIWDLVGDESKFKAFVREEALAYLQEAP